MPKLSDLTPKLAQASGLSEGSVTVYARTAREHNLINQGGRGRGGAEIGVDDCVNLLLAVAGADPVRNVPIVVPVLRAMTPVEDASLGKAALPPGFDTQEFQDLFGSLFATKRPLAEILAGLIDAARRGALQNWLEASPDRYVHLHIVRPFPDAWLEIGLMKGRFPHPVRQFGFELRADKPIAKRAPRPKGPAAKTLTITGHDLFTVARITHQSFRALGELLRRT